MGRVSALVYTVWVNGKASLRRPKNSSYFLHPSSEDIGKQDKGIADGDQHAPLGRDKG